MSPIGTDVGPLLTRLSGSIGDTVHARNQHGPYQRARTVPADPGTSRQVSARNKFGAANARWTNVLTPAQRQAWRDYARDLQAFTAEPRPSRIDGKALYMRMNVVRVGSVPPFRLDPPTEFRQPIWTTPTYQSLGTVGLGFYTLNVNDTWVSQDGAALQVFISPPQTSAINFYAGPWRRAASVQGNSVSPPAATGFFTDPWGPVSGNRRWARSFVYLHDGRVASPRIVPYADNI